MRLLTAILSLGVIASAQVVPTTPTKFGKRILGGGSGSAEVNITPPPQKERMVRMISYVTLSETRQWTSSDGRALVGKLIAFEDLVSEVPLSQASQATMQKLTGKPTVIQNQSARLLVNQTAYVLPLEKLSQPDRDFIESIRAAVAAGEVK